MSNLHKKAGDKMMNTRPGVCDFTTRVCHARTAGARYNTRPGVSLLVSLILISLLMLFGLIVSNVVMASIRDSANVNRANEAFYAAEGALEHGLLVNWNKGAGYTGPAEDLVFGNGVKATVKISGQAGGGKDGQQPFADGYSIPSPGTGDAGSDCDPLKAFTEGNFHYSKISIPHYITDAEYTAITDDNLKGNYSIGSYPAIDHPCNWSKLRVGESVTIPLYVTAANGDVKNPTDIDLKGLKIKVRTPCADGSEMCATNLTARYKLSSTPLNQQNPGNYNGDDPIVNWQIVGSQKEGNDTYILGPFDNYDSEFTGTWLIDQQSGKYTDEVIHSSKINKAIENGSIILDTTSQAGPVIDNQLCKQGLIINFLLNKNVNNKCPPWGGQNRIINKPVIKLSVIHSLVEAQTKNSIPYLEYQVLSSANIAPTDVAQTITAEAYSGSFKQVLEVKQPQSNGALEYVIQQ